jgi:hypothetical protein
LNPELALLSREVVSANSDRVVWLETWDLSNPNCGHVIFDVPRARGYGA